MNTDNTNTQDAAAKWWEGLSEKMKYYLLAQYPQFSEGVLVTDNQVLSIYLKEIDPLKEINERGKLIADLTGNKVFDTPTSIFLRGENDALKLENEALKERVKELEIHLKPKIHY